MVKINFLRNRLALLAVLACVVSILIGSIAFFTDRVSGTTADTAGTLDLVFKDISSSATGANGIVSPNSHALDKVWETGNLASAPILNPGDYFDLSYTISNEGNKSMDVRQRLVVTSTEPMSDTEGFQLTVTGENYDTKAVQGTLSKDALSLTYELSDVLLNGVGEGAETEKGISWTDQTYTVRLDFLIGSDKDFMGAGVTVDIDAQAKQHRNTDDSLWEKLFKDSHTNSEES